MIHRDYSGTAQTQIRVYPNKLVIMNQGMLPARVPASDLKISHLSVPGNTLLAEIFYNAGFIEALGYGTIRIKDYCLTQGLPEPDFEESAGAVKVTLYKNMLSEEYLKKLELNKRQRKTLALLDKSDSITNKTYRDTHRVSERTAFRDLNALVSYGILFIPGISAKPVTYCIRTKCEPQSNIRHISGKIDKNNESFSKMREIRTEQKSDNVLLGSCQDMPGQSDKLLDHTAELCCVHDTGHDKTTFAYFSYRLLSVMKGEMSRSEIMTILHLNHRETFYNSYLKPSLENGLIEMTIPGIPRSKKQKYRLTHKGSGLRKKLKAEK